ncbi:MAG: hypothetical protein AB7D01_03200 [Methanoculleus sp.]
MKLFLLNAVESGMTTLSMEATFVRRSPQGHILFRDVEFGFGYEDHVWVNRVAYRDDDIKQLRSGDRVRFIADLSLIRKKSGERSVRLECLRELRVIGHRRHEGRASRGAAAFVNRSGWC